MTNTNKLIKKNGLENVMRVAGKPCWQVFTISPTKKYTNLEIKSFLQQELLQAGFLWYGQHNMSFAHTKTDIARLLRIYDKIFARLKVLLEEEKLKENLKGTPITNIFKIR